VLLPLRPVGLRRSKGPFRLIAGALVAAVTVGTLAACSLLSNDKGTPERPSQADLVWPVPADASAAAEKAGLQMLGQEMLAVHYHAHLDVLINGGRVKVPPYIGIDLNKKSITALHTHDSSGIIHIESANDTPFTLGQVFTEWGQPLTATQVGQVKVPAGSELRVYRNGELADGDPNALKLNAHDEIEVWVGPTGDKPKVPSSFNFPQGL
jgi:hypothetical protein